MQHIIIIHLFLQLPFRDAIAIVIYGKHALPLRWVVQLWVDVPIHFASDVAHAKLRGTVAVRRTDRGQTRAPAVFRKGCFFRLETCGNCFAAHLLANDAEGVFVEDVFDVVR